VQTFSNISSKIYVNTQRIASKPAGNADRFNVMQVGDTLNLEELRVKQLADAQFVADSMELGQLNLAQPESGIIIIPAVFYFHPDHLGSSTLITDNFGDPYQFFLNLPFGANERKSHAVFLEVCERSSMAEQRRSGSFNNSYKFNGKELDEETGLYYYGARYYNPRTSVWLSVDPIALWQPVQEVEHYIEGQHNGGYFNPKNMSVYGYTYQNPLRYIDPNGKQVEWNKVWNNVKSGFRNIYTDHYKYSKNGNSGMPFPSVNQVYLHKNSMKTGVNYNLPTNKLDEAIINFAKGYLINKQKSIPTAKTTLPKSKNNILTLLNKATDIKIETQILNAGQIEISNWYGSFDINVLNGTVSNVDFEGFGDKRKSIFLTDESVLHYKIYSKLTGDLITEFDYVSGAENINKILGTDFMKENEINNFENLPTVD